MTTAAQERRAAAYLLGGVFGLAVYDKQQRDRTVGEAERPVSFRRAFFGYWELSRTLGTRGLRAPLWALSKVFYNRNTYGKWEGEQCERGYG